MKYSITRTLLGCDEQIELTMDQYQRVTAAKAGLLDVLSIEERLDLAIENYREFEQDLHGLTLHEMLFGGCDWSWFVSSAHTLNRRIANLLSACRLYIDQTKHDVSQLFGPTSEQYTQFRAALSAEYDAHLGYRVLEGLRNLVQHRMLPVAHISYRGSADEREAVRLAKSICTPSLSVSRLREEGFKPKVLPELEVLGEYVDLKPLVREYMASLGRVHIWLRSQLASSVSEWERTLEEVEQKFRAQFGDDVLGLAVVCTSDEGTRVESADIFRDFRERRRGLEKKNQDFTHLRSQFISSEVASDK